MSDFVCSNDGCANDVEYALCHVCDLAKYEADYKKAFDAGVVYQKTVAPPPKARALGMQLVKERLAWAEKKRAARDALEQVKAALGDRLLANGPLSMPYAHSVMRQIDAALTALGDEP